MTDLPATADGGFFAIGTDELRDSPRIRPGDHVACPHCGEPHPVTYGTKADGTRSDLLAAYRCTQTGASYLCGIDGHALPGVDLLRPAFGTGTQRGATVPVPRDVLRLMTECAADLVRQLREEYPEPAADHEVGVTKTCSTSGGGS